jgi:hypothetical protein
VGKKTKKLSLPKILGQIDSVHRELSLLSVAQRQGNRSALNSSDILDTYPLLFKRKTWDFLRENHKAAKTADESGRMERILFACTDLAVEKETASLADMLNFYSAGGKMHVGDKKIPLLEAVPWLQNQQDFDKREVMRKECSIYFKGINNPVLTGMLELTFRLVKEKCGYENYAAYSQAKKRVSFDDYAQEFDDYLERTESVYRQRITPWVEEKIGRPFENLSRYHALYLLRIKRFDDFFPATTLEKMVRTTFSGLGFDLSSRKDVNIDASVYPAKSPDGICVGVDIPGEVHVLMKPLGGLIDVETLLHETGHAYFLSNFDPELPVEYRRLYRSTALDETFAFLFMDLAGNPHWLRKIAGMPGEESETLAELTRTKRMCLIRRYMGKFLAEKELAESGDIKDSGPYCKHLHRATGFVYEPEGYLIDMEPDFYGLDYVRAWAASHVLQIHLVDRYGPEWFESPEAGEFLKSIAARGRKSSPEETVQSACGLPPKLPEYAVN